MSDKNHQPKKYSKVDTEDVQLPAEDNANGQVGYVAPMELENDPEAQVPSSDKELEEEHQGNKFTKIVEDAVRAVEVVYAANKEVLWFGVKIMLLTLYLGFLLFVLIKNFTRALPLFLITLALAGYFIIARLWGLYGDRVEENVFKPITNGMKKHRKLVSNISNFVMVISLITVLVAAGVFRQIIQEPIRLVSLCGLLVLLLISFVCSKYPSRINWGTVAWGMYLQVMLATFILRTSVGFEVFKFIGHEVEVFLNYALVGADFVFGPDPLKSHFFAFMVLPVVIFASAIFAMLFYFGIMQKFINAFAWLMYHTMGVSGVEAFGAAANVFLGMTIVPVAIKPYLRTMTLSELHSLIVGGFATIAGGVLAAYINMGIDAAHLISASIISAPAALVAAKMFYPETEQPKTKTSGSNVTIETTKEQNFFEAFCTGAIDGTKICGYIIGNLIAVISFLKFIDMTLLWLGNMADIDNLSFTLLCSYLLYPFAILLGIEGNSDCLKVAGLIGTKTFVNEFVAFTKLDEYIEDGQLQLRSQVIATYALCGFSNFGSIGILIGGMAPLVPDRISAISSLGLRALIAASVACQMTACIAGIMYDESMQHYTSPGNVTTTPLSGEIFTTLAPGR